MSLQFLPRRLTVFALLAFLLASALPPTVAAAGPAGYPGPRELVTARFRDLDAAVAAGVLDASVLTDLRAKGQARAIVTFDGDGILAQAQTQAPSGKGRSAAIVAAVRPGFAALKARALGAGSGLRVLRQYDALAATYLAVPSSAALLRLVNGVEVTGVRENHRSKATLAQSLDLIDQPEALADGHGGAGASIAVLDTGLDYTREAFGFCTAPGVPESCKVPFMRDFAPEDFQRDDAIGHGTNVSGIAAGVAPEAKVIGLDVFAGDLAEDSYVLAALDWIVANQAPHNIRALNMSLGDVSYSATTCYDSPLEPALASVRAVGVLPLIAAGNSAADGGSFTNGIAYPACTKGAVSVGAVYDSSVDPYCASETSIVADQITCFSQSASILGLLAPGADITAAGITMGGTSQATPHVAGAAAVLAGAKSIATPAAIETALKNSGPSIVDNRNGVSKHRLDLDDAVDFLLAAAAGVTWEPQVYEGPYGAWSYDENLSRTVQSGTTWLHTVHMRARDTTYAVEYQRTSIGGATWSPTNPTRLNSKTQYADLGVTAASGSYVYAAWMSIRVPYSGSNPRAIYFRAHPSHGATSTAWKPIAVRTPTGGRVSGPSIAASGTYVYLAYTDSNTGAIRIQRSADNGVTWLNLPSPGTTTATAGTSGRWGTPEIAVAGSRVIVAWFANNTGSLKVRVSGNKGNSWVAATTVDSNAWDLSVAALGTRLAVGWTDPTQTRSKVWSNGTWLATRTVAFLAGTYDAHYGPVISLVGTAGLGVAWSACKTPGCNGTTIGTGVDLEWRESANNGGTWKAVTVLASSAESPHRRINDAADVEWSSPTRRHVMFNGWTPDFASHMYMRTGTGT